jgi:hypothetical protein
MKLHFSRSVNNEISNKTEVDCQTKQIFTQMEQQFQNKFYCPAKSSVKRKLAGIKGLISPPVNCVN